MNPKFRNILLLLSFSLLLIALAVNFYLIEEAPYLFAVGAAGLSVARLTRRYTGKNARLRHLYRMETISAMLMLVVSYMLFEKEAQWILFLTVAAVIQLYASLIIPKEEAKGEEKDDEANNA